MSQESSFQSRLIEVVARAQEVDFRPYEDDEGIESSTELVSRVSNIAEAGHGLLEELLDCYVPDVDPIESVETVKPLSEKFDRALDQIVERRLADQLPSLCFFAWIEVRQKLVRLRALEPEELEISTVVSACGSLLRKLIRASTAIENALCEGADLESQLSYVSETQLSSKIREAYAVLRWSILSDGREPKGTSELRAGLTTAATAIAKLRGHDLYYELRPEDRATLSGLQRRIFEWMGGQDESDSATGERIWADLVCALELLRTVSRRSELREQDRRVIDDLWTELDGDSGEPNRISERGAKRLESLFGLDDELDRTLRSPNPPDLRRVRSALERLREDLFRPEPGESQSGDFEKIEIADFYDGAYSSEDVTIQKGKNE